MEVKKKIKKIFKPCLVFTSPKEVLDQMIVTVFWNISKDAPKQLGFVRLDE